MYVHTVVLWCISSGYCCSKLLCKTWGEYFFDSNGCRSIGAVDRFTTESLSLVPFFGLSSFYKGNMFDGFCEVINAVMAVISILACCCCHTDRHTSVVARYIAVVIVVLDLAKVFHMAAAGSVDKYEIAVIITSILLIYLYCCCAGCTDAEVYGIIPALLVTIATGGLETLRDYYLARNNDKDGFDCPFI